MPRRSILSVIERDSLLAIPDTQDDLIRLYTFSEHDLSIIKQHRGSANKLGFAIQLCYMRYPGMSLAAEDRPFTPLLRMTAEQLKIPISY
jgi:TnpA family transposase